MPEPVTDKGLTSTGKLVLVILAGLLVAVGGTIGFMVIEGMTLIDAAYMTAITLSTVGFGEVTPLHPAGRIFVIILLIFGIAVATTFAAIIGQQVIEGHFKSLVTRRKMENRLKKLSDHCILAGFGRVGRQVAREFERKMVPWVVIEKDETSIEPIISKGAIVVVGDATDDEVLLRAGIDRAKTLISTLPEEAQNVYLTLTARYMNPKLKIIARADYDDGEKKLL
ncbi:MAG: potassium channel family protein, partial [candidate division Zixibacteria bacterium]|nr:potassium channel family protein [candidate division Zixibacteria bacterium]